MEVTTRYATSVDTLQEAFAFIMEHMERVGGDPSIHISPVWHFDTTSPSETTRVFSVVVDGMVESP